MGLHARRVANVFKSFAYEKYIEMQVQYSTFIATESGNTCSAGTEGLQSVRILLTSTNEGLNDKNLNCGETG